jgi:hypothetical protein
VIVAVAVQADPGVVEMDELDVVEDNMHEHPELNFDGEALQAVRKVGMPVVAVCVDARNGVQNEDAETA